MGTKFTLICANQTTDEEKKRGTTDQ